MDESQKMLGILIVMVLAFVIAWVTVFAGLFVLHLSDKRKARKARR